MVRSSCGVASCRGGGELSGGGCSGRRGLPGRLGGRVCAGGRLTRGQRRRTWLVKGRRCFVSRGIPARGCLRHLYSITRPSARRTGGWCGQWANMGAGVGKMPGDAGQMQRARTCQLHPRNACGRPDASPRPMHTPMLAPTRGNAAKRRHLIKICLITSDVQR